MKLDVMTIMMIAFGFGVCCVMLGMFSLDVGRMAVHDKMEDIFGEGYITTDCDGGGATFDCNVYTKDGEYLGRYHQVAAWKYLFDKQSAYEDAIIIKLEE